MNPAPEFVFGYAAMVLLGLAVMVFFRPASHYGSTDKRQYWRLQAITFAGAIVGSKLAVLVGDALWPLQPMQDWWDLLLSGRSIAGALLGGFMTAELAKPWLGYTLPPNDRFAVILPLTIATGRVGCWLAGCCQGVAMDEPLGVVAQDGVRRFPAPLAEMVFHLACAAGLYLLWRRRLLGGRLFALFLGLYGVFRFTTEFWRETEKAFWGWSAYQWLALAMVGVAAATLILRHHLRVNERGQLAP
jgi:phosphatidylglycerol---prolipoprotein diacylglyceryl transferase